MKDFSQLSEVIYNAFISMEVTPLSATIKLIISFILGAIIGVERQTRRQSAGMRTFTLICMSCTLAMILSVWIPQSYPHLLNGDPGRIAAQILTGIGFLGAGAIIQGQGSVHGMTTAACIWAVSIIGMCVGAGLYLPAVVLTMFSLFILIMLERIEKRRKLTGDVKVLSVQYKTSSPNIEEVKNILMAHSIYILGINSDRNFSGNTSQAHFRVQVKPKESYDTMFHEIEKLTDISGISINYF